MMKSLIIICVFVGFCITYSEQRSIKNRAVFANFNKIQKTHLQNGPPPNPPSSPLLIRKKRDLDFGGLFDGFGLGEDIIKFLIEKITDLITSDCGDSQKSEETASAAPLLIRKKRDIDLGSLGLDGLGLDADTLKKLTDKIMDFITGSEADCGQSAVTGSDGPKPTEAVTGGGASGATGKPPASGAPQTTPGAAGGASTPAAAPATTNKPVPPPTTTAKPESPPPAATTEGVKPPPGGNTGGAVTDGVKPTPPLTQKPTETPAAPTTRRCRPHIQLCFF